MEESKEQETETTTTKTTMMMTNSGHQQQQGKEQVASQTQIQHEEEIGEGIGAGGATMVENKKVSILEQAKSEALRPFVIISSSYLLFTVTDGAIRMIVLLHAYSKNFSALEVSVMFTLYELAGVFTNLMAGFCGAKWGIKVTLITGLVLQLFSYSLLFGWKDEWTKVQAIVYVTIAQMFAGIAKDLTKLGGKTVTKLVTPDEKETKLFKLVSFITGWKNSLKGVGYFLGSALISIQYELALWVMMGLVLLAMPWAILGLDKNLGTAKNKNASFRDIFVMDNTNLNILSAARLFLFASRDFWFEVPLPFYLRSPSCIGLGQCSASCVDVDGGMEYTCMDNNNLMFQNELTQIDVCPSASICNMKEQLCENINIGGGCGGLGFDRVLVGAMLGGYIILYGQVQSWTPQLVTGPLRQTPPNKYTEVLWGMINCIPTLLMCLVITFSPAFNAYDNELRDEKTMITWMVIVVVSFAVIFAINSSIHSFLVVNYASREKIAVSVGLYYMSNALGRLLGTLGSGFLYTYAGEFFVNQNNPYSGPNASAGLAVCFLAGTISSLLAALITTRISDKSSHKNGLPCGSSCTIIAPSSLYDDNNDDDGDIEKTNEHDTPPNDTDNIHNNNTYNNVEDNSSENDNRNDNIKEIGEGKRRNQYEF